MLVSLATLEVVFLHVLMACLLFPRQLGRCHPSILPIKYVDSISQRLKTPSWTPILSRKSSLS